MTMQKSLLIKFSLALAILFAAVTANAQTNASYLRIGAMPVSAVSPLDYLVYGKQSGTNYFWYHRFMQDFFADLTNSPQLAPVYSTISGNSAAITSAATTVPANLTAESNTLAAAIASAASTDAANLTAASNVIAGKITSAVASDAANLTAASNTLAATITSTSNSTSNSLTASILAAVPAYNLARIQFSGYPATITIGNNGQTAYGLLSVPANSFPAAYGPPYCVSVLTNASQIQIATFQTNTPFYVVPTATNNAWVHVFPSYAAAVSGTGYLPVIGAGAGTANQFVYLTNYTSVNADVTFPAPGLITVGHYDIWFRTNAPTALYYVTGTTAGLSGNAYQWGGIGIVNMAPYGYTPTVSNFRIATYYDNNSYWYDCGLVQVSVNPQ